MRKAEFVIIGIILLSFLIGIYFYPKMPELIASHWNSQGIADGYMPKIWGLFLMPLISVGIFLLFLAVPRIDPRKANIAKFRKYFDGFIVIIFVFLLYIYSLSIFWNLGERFNFVLALVPAFALIFFYAGVLMEKAKRNWFIGIRTPWTLSSENVWNKTHKIGGKLFKIAGLLSLLGLFFGDYALAFVLIPVIAFAVFLIVYSFVEYQKEQSRK